MTNQDIIKDASEALNRIGTYPYTKSEIVLVMTDFAINSPSVEQHYRDKLKGEAVEFAEWTNNNCVCYSKDSKWQYGHDFETRYTTAELHALFLTSKGLGNVSEKSGWISVEEKLPEYHEWVLAWVGNISLLAIRSKSEGWVIHFSDGKRLERDQARKISHWMPLPQAPVKVSEKREGEV